MVQYALQVLPLCGSAVSQSDLNLSFAMIPLNLRSHWIQATIGNSWGKFLPRRRL